MQSMFKSDFFSFHKHEIFLFFVAKHRAKTNKLKSEGKRSNTEKRQKYQKKEKKGAHTTETQFETVSTFNSQHTNDH